MVWAEQRWWFDSLSRLPRNAACRLLNRPDKLNMMERAQVQFGDLCGTASADERGVDGGLTKLAEAAGIDTQRYFPVGLEAAGLKPEVAAILAIDMQGVGACTFESVQDHVRADPARVTGVRFLVEHLPVDAYLKRLHIDLHRNINGLQSVNFQDA